VDFVGINVYRPLTYVLASDEPGQTSGGWREIPFAKANPKMFNSWLTLGPEVLYWAPKFVQSLRGQKRSASTENGCANDDVRTAVKFLRRRTRTGIYLQRAWHTKSDLCAGPFNSNSPTGSTFTAFSTFINTCGLMRI
jgi:hypothetical protein